MYGDELIEFYRPDDIVIAVMGISGCGKSTFVNLFSDYLLAVGHSLNSCTEIIQVVPCTLRSGKKIYLVDTPGFDDIYRSDADILREIANWLNTAHESRIKLTGIIYLHRIFDVRFGGGGIKNIRMFKKLCGENGPASVVLAITMWDFVPEEVKNSRKSEIQQQSVYWKQMMDHGSKVFSQDEGRTSAMRIIQYLISRQQPVVPNI
ncbi:P-loop containing nucleoside triphosphate hydrolase protein [Dendryphion nanum]|uniref:P-loop containing nucleoside triphosphate hydrolase protein n=1 Tax=Dendryphion nanum TaxID=256645 RepID=A0A9P9IPX9_9PLEO|nr:P-loop containing nucleoside triphosphate hydrolase protein [Dendryphion nanum]